MSLRRRLLALILLILPLSLIVGGLLSFFYSLSVVESEVRIALNLAGNSVSEAVSQINPNGDPSQHLARLVATFDNDRDVRVRLVGPDGKVQRSSRPLPTMPPAPKWLQTALYPEAKTVVIPLPDRISQFGSIRLDGVADNEISEVWEEMKLQFAILAGFFTLILWLVSFTLDRALRPLDKLATGLGEVRRGNFNAQVAENGPQELNIIYREFNRMAQGLQEAERRNKLLSTQLGAVQEEERKELARDLHDEVGPFLFAIDVDAQTIPEFIERGTLGDVTARVSAIRQSVAHVQAHVRAILGRLRPTQFLDLGLTHAVDYLTAFWKRRHSDLTIHADFDQSSYGPEVDDVAFRIVQESLNNAIRHGEPTHIQIKGYAVCDRDPAVLELSIVDDGGGISPMAGAGFGIAGMRERAEAIGGSLDVAPSQSASGIAVVARLPLPDGTCLCAQRDAAQIENDIEEKGQRL
ncbi:MAG: histidine kinase [Hyphomicrobiaceae bacterium]